MAAAHTTTKSLALTGALAGAAGSALFYLLPATWAAPLTAIVWTAAAHRWPAVSGITLAARGGLLVMLDAASWQSIWPVLIASQVVPRMGAVVLAWVSRPARAGPGTAFAGTLTSGRATFAILVGLLAALATGWRSALAMLGGGLILSRVVQLASYHRQGGLNTDSLYFAQILMEIWVLLLFNAAF